MHWHQTYTFDVTHIYMISCVTSKVQKPMIITFLNCIESREVSRFSINEIYMYAIVSHSI